MHQRGDETTAEDDGETLNRLPSDAAVRELQDQKADIEIVETFVSERSEQMDLHVLELMSEYATGYHGHCDFDSRRNKNRGRRLWVRAVMGSTETGMADMLLDSMIGPDGTVGCCAQEGDPVSINSGSLGGATLTIGETETCLSRDELIWLTRFALRALGRMDGVNDL